MITELPGHVFCYDLQGKLMACNLLQAKALGFATVEAAIGCNVFDYQAQEDIESLKLNNEKVVASNATLTVEEPFTNQAGEKRKFISKKLPFRNEAGEVAGILGIAFDISERAKQEKEQVGMLEDIIGLVPGNIWWKNRDCKFLGCNNNQAEMAGFSNRREAIGKKSIDFISKKLPLKVREEEAQKIDEVDRSIMHNKEGRTVEEPMLLDDGSETIYLSRKEPLLNEDNKVIGLVGISVDITAEKNTRRLEQEKIVAQEKANTIKLLAAAMAHEISTPMGSLKPMRRFIKQLFPRILALNEAIKKLDAAEALSDKEVARLERIPNSLDVVIKKTSNFTEMLLQKVKSADGTIDADETISIVEAVNEALEEYHDSEGVEIIWDASVDFQFRGEHLAFVHIIFNLLKNAIFYVRNAPGGGHIEIRAEVGETENILHFKDTGTGMPKEVLVNIFDSFYTRTRHGTGVGLAYCKLVMESFGGTIECDSKEGKYTHFALRFPKI